MSELIFERTEVELEDDEVFYIPNNCWAFVEKDGKKKLVQASSIKGSEAHKLVLVPKVAGG